MSQFYEIRLISFGVRKDPITLERWEKEHIARKRYEEWVKEQPKHGFVLVRVSEDILESTPLI